MIPVSMRARLLGLLDRLTWNLAGVGVPLLAGVIFVPLALKALGAEKFGIVTLIWALTGVSSLLDFGLAQAITRHVARRRSAGEAGLAPEISLLFSALVCFSVIIGIALAIGANAVVDGMIRPSPANRTDVYWAIILSAATVPLVVGAAGLKAVTDGLELFRAPSIMRIVLSSLTFVLPFAFAGFDHPLTWICGAVLALRLLWCAAHYGIVRRHGRLRLHAPGTLIAKRRELASLFRESGWIAMSNLVGPAILQGDRFYLPSIASASAVILYTVPFEIFSRLVMFIVAIGQVIFPMYVRLCETVQTGAARARRVLQLQLLVVGGQGAISAIMFFAGDLLLSRWLGAGYQPQMSETARILAVTFFIQASAYPLVLYLQASGRPHVSGLVNLTEAILYIVYMPFAVHWLARGEGPMAGLTGLAYLALARVTLSAIMVHAATYGPLLRRRSDLVALPAALGTKTNG